MISDATLHLTLALAALPGNVSQKADLLKVHRTTMHRWTSGRTLPREEDWATLSRLPDVPLGTLRYGPTPVLRSMLPRPRPTRAEVLRMSGTLDEVSAITGHTRSTILRWRRAASPTP
jgi:hypothetical protein